MAVAQIIIGLICLAAGGEVLVRGAVGAAQRLRVSPLITGLVIVGFGTSMPELAASLSAVAEGSPGIAVGNVVGSNIANILLILGIAAVICPITAGPEAFKRDAPMMAATTVIFAILAFYGAFGRFLGASFVALLLAYVYFTYRAERRSFDEQARIHAGQGKIAGPTPRAIWFSLVLAAAGTALIIFGAKWTVDGSVVIAHRLGITETIIGLTIVAVGTSLPELAASTAAALRKEADIAFGNILGSNIFNILGILGLTSMAVPFGIPKGVLLYDLWILIGTTALLLYFAFTEARICRWEGAIFLALYVVYIGLITARATGTI